eukprot:6474604-Amphidinium_carterae.3
MMLMLHKQTMYKATCLPSGDAVKLLPGDAADIVRSLTVPDVCTCMCVCVRVRTDLATLGRVPATFRKGL